MHKRIISGLICFLLLLPSLAFPWQGQVVAVLDGDILTILHEGQEEKVRLFGVDSPEIQQAFGKDAKQFLSDMVFGRIVEIEPKNTDSYGRTVGLVHVDGKVVNEELVRAGLAWVYTKYCKDSFCSEWKNMQESAAKRQIGLWSALDAMPPWDFRQVNSTRANANRQDTLPSHSAPRRSDYYHGNTIDHVFHAPECKHYDCPTCIVPFKTRSEAIRARYKPCGICGP
ncbi:MAG: thermonuclease family protein [Syntrophobacteraceae bacterium]